jgi:YVTN family beta-propeller protein
VNVSNKIFLFFILLSLILAFYAAEIVNAVEVTATIPLNAGMMVYDSGKVVATVSLGNNPGPSTLIYDSGKGEIFASCTNTTKADNSNFIKVISDSTNKVVATVPLDNYPALGVYDSGRSEIWVTSPIGNSTSVISDNTNTVVATIPVGGVPFALAYDIGKDALFVANSADNTVSIISDSANNVVATVSVGNFPTT